MGGGGGGGGGGAGVVSESLFPSRDCQTGSPTNGGGGGAGVVSESLFPSRDCQTGSPTNRLACHIQTPHFLFCFSRFRILSLSPGPDRNPGAVIGTISDTGRDFQLLNDLLMQL